MVQFPLPALTGADWVAVGSPGSSLTPLALMAPVPVLAAFTVKVTGTEPARGALSVRGAAGDTKVAVIGQAAVWMVRARVAALEDRPAAFFAVTLTVLVPLAR